MIIYLLFALLLNLWSDLPHSRWENSKVAYARGPACRLVLLITYASLLYLIYRDKDLVSNYYNTIIGDERNNTDGNCGDDGSQPKVLNKAIIYKIRIKYYMFNMAIFTLLMNQLSHECLDPSLD